MARVVPHHHPVKRAGKIFAAGLLTLIPIVATVSLVLWIFVTAEAFFSFLLIWLLPERLHFPGMGILLAILITFGVGLLLHSRQARRLMERAEQAVLSIPLVSSLYSAIRDFMQLFIEVRQDDVLQVVALTLPGSSMRVLGFITRSDFSELPEGVVKAEEVAVYLPMSYQVGGYTLFVSREQLEPLAMSREAAMRFIITAGVNVSARTTPSTDLPPRAQSAPHGT